VSDVRALFLTGTLDWNTPPYQAEMVRWGMPNAQHLIVENVGHEQIIPQREVQTAIIRFLQGEDVRDVKVIAPEIRFVPIDGFDPEVTHPSASLAQHMLAVVGAEGLDAALSRYRDLRAEHPTANMEREINALGYGLLNRGRLQDAIAVFTMNTEDYAEAFNTWDSLGEAYRATGDRERAIEYYDRSLELNPDNTNAVRMLEEMGAR
jgi:tetratricopeptide (TPR) repeat protein